MEWTEPPHPLPPAAGEVHVWRIDQRLWRPHRGALEILLDASERRRAGRFRFESLAERFVVARARQRVLLGRYLVADPAGLRFREGTCGKPELDLPAPSPALHFNLAHSGDLALLAVSAACPVGIDIEDARRDVEDLVEIVERFFSPGERRRMAELGGEERRRAFFAGWTRKEAFIKAVGEGLSMPLDSFEVELRPSAAAAILSIGGSAEEASSWRMHDVAAADGYAAAVAWSGESLPCRFFDDIPPA